MKNIMVILFFSVLSIMLVACGEKQQADNKTTEQVENTQQEDGSAATEKKATTTTTDTAAVNNESVALGEELVKRHCSSCHQAEMYTRAESKIKSADALLTQIKACDANIGTGLFDEDMAAIAAYLDKNFYKFAK